ncbi:MAG TPA: DUF378 domain-containing protein [Candidatus Paceibacterota bacterium]|nr:DUF378 domain-containing protein [Candidatus Paceibacterota bacterium]
MKAVHVIAFILVVVGAINWGLVGIFQWNLVTAIFGSVSWLERLVYILVGLSGLVLLFTHKKECKACESKMAPAAM